MRKHNSDIFNALPVSRATGYDPWKRTPMMGRPMPTEGTHAAGVVKRAMQGKTTTGRRIAC